MTENLNRIPVEDFIFEVPAWRDKFVENNRCVFKVEAFVQREWTSPYLNQPLCKENHSRVEELIEELKGKLDYEIGLERDMEIVYRWGGGLGPRLFSQIMNSEKNSPTPTKIQQQMKAAFDALGEGRPTEALEELKRLKYCSDAFGTKVLAMRSPWKSPIWDNVAQHCLRELTIGGKRVGSYEQFIRFCEHIADELSRLGQPAPRGGGRWYLRDIEMAVFQFGWDHGKFNGRITGELP